MTCYDEIRIAGWEPNPNGEKLTPGQILSRAHTIAAYNIVKKVRPRCHCLYVVGYVHSHSTMQSPAARTTYGGNGNFENAIQGIPTDMGIMNWNLGRGGNESIPLLCRQRFSPGFLRLLRRQKCRRGQAGARDRWMNAAGNIKNIDGMMYTTWEHNYRDSSRISSKPWTRNPN